MTTLYHEPKTQLYFITRATHEHFYRLTLRAGCVVAVCECGAILTAAQIEAWLNAKG